MPPITWSRRLIQPSILGRANLYRGRTASGRRWLCCQYPEDGSGRWIVYHYTPPSTGASQPIARRTAKAAMRAAEKIERELSQAKVRRRKRANLARERT